MNLIAWNSEWSGLREVSFSSLQNEQVFAVGPFFRVYEQCTMM